MSLYERLLVIEQSAHVTDSEKNVARRTLISSYVSNPLIRDKCRLLQVWENHLLSTNTEQTDFNFRQSCFENLVGPIVSYTKLSELTSTTIQRWGMMTIPALAGMYVCTKPFMDFLFVQPPSNANYEAAISAIQFSCGTMYALSSLIFSQKIQQNHDRATLLVPKRLRYIEQYL